MFYSAKRQQFLIDQGYSFKVLSPSFSPPHIPILLFVQVITRLGDVAGLGGWLCYGTKQEQLDLLKQVLGAGEEECDDETLVEVTPSPLFASSILAHYYVRMWMTSRELLVSLGERRLLCLLPKELQVTAIYISLFVYALLTFIILQEILLKRQEEIQWCTWNTKNRPFSTVHLFVTLYSKRGLASRKK